MSPTLRTSLMGALLGSVAVAGTLALFVLLGVIPKAPYVALWQAVAGGGWVLAAVLGGILFLLIGALWGLPMSWVGRPTVWKGMLVGVLPTLWVWTALAAYQGQPLFAGGDLKGLLIPVLMNVVIWGSILGAYAVRNTRPLGSNR